MAPAPFVVFVARPRVVGVFPPSGEDEGSLLGRCAPVRARRVEVSPFEQRSP